MDDDCSNATLRSITMKNQLLAIFIAGLWINLCEFLRNSVILHQQWLDKYNSLGLSFPETPINGSLWIVWGFLFAACIVALSGRHTFKATFLLSWSLGFLMMWIVIWNLNVLPISLLPVAVPWSMVEVLIAVILARKIAWKRSVMGFSD